jgi:hypothetical protein
MATSGGPRLEGIGRSSNNLVLNLDSTLAASYPVLGQAEQNITQVLAGEVWPEFLCAPILQWAEFTNILVAL